MIRRLFIFVWGLQIVSLCYLITVFERYTEGQPLTRMRVLWTVVALLCQFSGIVFMWVQSARINDLEYGQQKYSETLHAALTKDTK